jgi:tetratricopeptide (TPR) repeat protein
VLNPNFGLAMGTRGLAKIYDGAPLDAIPDLERAVRLDPLMGHQYWHFIGSAYLVAGQYGKAVEAFRQRIRLAPDADLFVSGAKRRSCAPRGGEEVQTPATSVLGAQPKSAVAFGMSGLER